MLGNRIPMLIHRQPLSERDLYFLASLWTPSGLAMTREEEVAIDIQLEEAVVLATGPVGQLFEEVALNDDEVRRIDNVFMMTLESFISAIAKVVTMTSKAALHYREGMERKEGESDQDYFHRVMMRMEFGMHCQPSGAISVRIRTAKE